MESSEIVKRQSLQAGGQDVEVLKCPMQGLNLKFLSVMNYYRSSASCQIVNAPAISIDHCFPTTNEAKWNKKGLENISRLEIKISAF